MATVKKFGTHVYHVSITAANPNPCMLLITSLILKYKELTPYFCLTPIRFEHIVPAGMYLVFATDKKEAAKKLNEIDPSVLFFNPKFSPKKMKTARG